MTLTGPEVARVRFLLEELQVRLKDDEGFLIDDLEDEILVLCEVFGVEIDPEDYDDAG